MTSPTRAEQRWKQAMQQAGYTRATGIATFHFSHLVDPCGDRNAAERAYRQLLADLPDNRAALQGLAHLLQLQGRRSEALPYRHRLLQLHAGDLGVAQDALAEAADYLLSAESGRSPPVQAPQAYVEGLFDQYAGNFDLHLVDKLRYRGPGLLLKRFTEQLSAGCSALDILDIGCGTGLAGEAFKPLAGRLEGIDLSQKMLDAARARDIYDRLDRGEILELLQQCTLRYDLIVAADVLAYFGDLRPLFQAVAAVLHDTGHFVFTVEKGEAPGYRLRSSGRYQHAVAYLQECARRAGFEFLSCAVDTLREQDGQPVTGCFAVLQKVD